MSKALVLPLLVGLSIVLLASSAPADSRIEKSLKLESGGRFVLESDEGSVTVMGTSAPGARVVITSNRDDLEDLFHFSFEGDAKLARVTARREHQPSWGRGVSIHFEVQVPAETQLEIKTGDGNIEASGMRGDADLNTSDGNLEVSGLAGKLTAHTADGNIHLREITGSVQVRSSDGNIQANSIDGALNARTADGWIRLEKVTGSVVAATGDGDINVEDAGGRVEAKTSDGKVRVAFAKANASGGELETADGSVDVTLDRAVNLNVEASTTDNSVTTDLPIKLSGESSGSHLAGSIGSGGARLIVRAHDGPVRIEAR
jgi:DUF4097 and DUF4098 domain-containing protein YvlB